MILIKALKALADERRLKILQLLSTNDLCVGALAKHLGISKPAVSQHLQILRKAGLVKGEKRGYWTHYIVERQALNLVASEISDLTATEISNNTICWRIDDTYKTKKNN
jgi:DNA-binding transcriptional ArsR family regulator